MTVEIFPCWEEITTRSTPVPISHTMSDHVSVVDQFQIKSLPTHRTFIPFLPFSLTSNLSPTILSTNHLSLLPTLWVPHHAKVKGRITIPNPISHNPIIPFRGVLKHLLTRPRSATPAV